MASIHSVFALAGSRKFAADISCQRFVEFFDGWQIQENIISLDFDRKRADVVFLALKRLAGLKRERLFVQRARDLGLATSIAQYAAGKHECFLVRTHVLACIPCSTAGEIEHGDLSSAILDGRAPIRRKVGYGP